MKIILRTSVEPQSQNHEKEEVAISFETDDLVNIINKSGVQAGNEALDKLVNQYILDVKKVISNVMNK